MAQLATVLPRDHPLHASLAALDARFNTAELPGVIISGAPRSGKSSLGLQMAVSVAMHGQGPSAVLVNEERLAMKTPRPFFALDELPLEVLQRIEFHYVDSHRDCRVFTTDAVYAMSPLPRVILVDDDGFVDGGERLEVAKTLAALCNTVEWIRQRVPDRQCFFVYVTSLSGGAPWPGAAPLAFPLSRYPLHLCTRAEAPVDDALTWSCAVHHTETTEAEGPLAMLVYQFPTHRDDAPMCLV